MGMVRFREGGRSASAFINPPRPQQRHRRLGVVDLPARRLLHGHLERYALDVEDLVVLQLLLRLLEAGGEEEPDLLVGEAGGGPDPAEGLQLRRAVADLLLGLAAGAGLGGLAAVELAGGDLQEPAASGVAVL